MQAEKLTLWLQEINVKYADLMLYLMVEGEPIVPMISDTETAVFVYVSYPKDIEGEESRLLGLLRFSHKFIIVIPLINAQPKTKHKTKQK